MISIDFRNKTVWITGASSGIGASLAYQLNALGAKVIASARRKEKLMDLKKTCEYPINMRTIELDITDQNSIEEAILFAGQLEKIDLVVHNAGIAHKGMVIENDIQIDRTIMETNYFGTVAFTKAIMPIFLKQGYGWFAVVSSFAGLMGIPGRSSYAASKHALHGFFDSLKAENMSCKIDVSFIIPGFINTDITAKGLCGNGKPYGKVETSHRLGMTANQCAEDIINGLKKKKKRIVIGKYEVYLISINRWAPTFAHFIIKNHPMKRIRRFKSSMTGIFKLKPYGV